MTNVHNVAIHYHKHTISISECMLLWVPIRVKTLVVIIIVLQDTSTMMHNFHQVTLGTGH